MSALSDVLVECILNLSEGRDRTKLDAVSEIIVNTPSCIVLHRDIGWDANRTVYTIVGDVHSLFQALRRIFVFALEHWDIRSHVGVHPYVGILDVIPFVPLWGISHQQLSTDVKDFCQAIAHAYDLPIITYGDLSQDPDRMTLAYIRKGGIQHLDHRLQAQELCVDYGPSLAHARLGVSCVTVRPLMIAYNINLDTQDLQLAQMIARQLKDLRKRNEALKGVRFLGWHMERYQCCQISMNNYNIPAISMVDLYHLVQQVAAQHGIDLIGSELIGLAPEYALSHNRLLLAQAVDHLGLNRISDFDPQLRILDVVLGRRIL